MTSTTSSPFGSNMRRPNLHQHRRLQLRDQSRERLRQAFKNIVSSIWGKRVMRTIAHVNDSRLSLIGWRQPSYYIDFKCFEQQNQSATSPSASAAPRSLATGASTTTKIVVKIQSTSSKAEDPHTDLHGHARSCMYENTHARHVLHNQACKTKTYMDICMRPSSRSATPCSTHEKLSQFFNFQSNILQYI
jgi:hypothetical protein